MSKHDLEREFINANAVTESVPQYGAISYHNEPKDPPRFAGGGLAKKAAKNLSKFMEGSKVVDEAGNPKVVYHGTTAKEDFSQFNPASFFTSSPEEASAYTMYKDLMRKESALKKYSLSNDTSHAGKYVPYTGTLSDVVNPKVGSLYATDNGVFQYAGDGRWQGMSKLDVDYNNYDPKTDSMMLKKSKRGAAVNTVKEHRDWANKKFTEGEGGRVYPVYLDIKNPVELNAMEANLLGKRVGADDDLIREFIDKYSKQGYDAIVTKSDEATFFPEVRESLGGIPTQYIPFKPEQIKSAVGNRGTYDPNEADITKAGGGLAKKAVKKAVERMSKAESEAVGLYHPIGGGLKLPKPVSEYKFETIQDPRFSPEVRRLLSPEDFLGKVGIPLLGDRARAGRLLTEIEGRKLDEMLALEGGPEFMMNYPYLWASDKAVINKLAKQARKAAESGKDVLGVNVIGSPTNVDFNKMVSGVLFDNLDVSSLRKKDIKAFDTEMRKSFPEFLGLEHPEVKEQMFGPNMGTKRTEFVKIMNKDKYQSSGFPDVTAARIAVTEPRLLDMPTGSSGFTVGKFDPENLVIENPEIAHETYPVKAGGEYVGGLEAPLDFKDVFTDFSEARRMLGGDPTRDLRAFSFQSPAIQEFNQEWLDKVMPTYEEILKSKRYAGGGLLKKVSKEVLKSKGKYGAERVEKAADLVPDLEKQFNEEALYRAFTGDNAKGLMVLDPAHFEEYAEPLSPTIIQPGKYSSKIFMAEDIPEGMSYEEYLDHLLGIASKGGFRDVPFLEIGEKGANDFRVTGHEGRHRTRALTKRGDKKTLIQMLPGRGMREPFPRYSQEEYIDAINEHLGLDPEVSPEVFPDVKLPMPKIFAKGGSANLEEEFKTANTVADPRLLPKSVVKALNTKRKLSPAEAKIAGKYANPENQWDLGSILEEIDPLYTASRGARTLKNVDLGAIGDIALQRYQLAKDPRASIEKGIENIGEAAFGALDVAPVVGGVTSKTGRNLIKNLVKEFEGAPAGLSIQDVTPKSVNFVSSVEKAIKGHKMESMNGEQWANWMRANASKSAKKEAEATGLYNWLKSQGKVSKAEIEAYVEGNLPQIARIEKGAPLKLTPQDEIRLSELWRRHSDTTFYGGKDPLDYDEYNELMRLENIRDKKSPEDLLRQSQMFEESAKKAQAKGDKEAAESLWRRSEHLSNRAEALELNPLEVGGSKFEKWKEPGGEKYRETLLVLPENRKINKAAYDFAEAKGISREEMDTNPDVREAVFAEMGKTTPVYEPSTAFRSKHWDEPNVLMHIRSNERMTPEGKRALFLEELQSDWAQKARKTGIKQDVTDDMLREYHESVRKETDPTWEDLPSKDKAFLRHVLENRQIDAVPNAPYITDTGDWTKLGLKQALKDAIEGGHDYLAWTTGEQQAKRYDLSKQVSEIAYHPKGRALEVFDIEGNNIINEDGINPEDLADYIGKEYAEKVLNSPEIDRGYNILKGDNLRVGGEGMKAYYDQMVPQYMKDVLKQYGIKDDIKPIEVEIFPAQRASQYDSPETTGRSPGDIVRPARYSTQMGIEITPELREKILNEGLPHFDKGGTVGSMSGRDAIKRLVNEFSS